MNATLKNIFEPELLQKIEEEGKLLHFKAGDIIMQPGKYIKIVPLLIKGSVKISREDANGNEIFLYYLTEGQSCASSMSIIFSENQSNIKAIAEEDSDLLAISTEYAMEWFNEYPSWRKFVMQTMQRRCDELMNTVDSIAFSKTDERLMHFLQKKAEMLQTNTIQITHQEIANELSTSREVISRLLKQLERKEKLKLSRNKIELL